jgi:hypothetical protein
MTFAEMRTAVTDYCHLTSADAILRVGKSLNRHYRRVTSLVGLDTARFVTRTTSVSPGARTATFAEIEKKWGGLDFLQNWFMEWNAKRRD